MIKTLHSRSPTTSASVRSPTTSTRSYNISTIQPVQLSNSRAFPTLTIARSSPVYRPFQELTNHIQQTALSNIPVLTHVTPHISLNSSQHVHSIISDILKNSAKGYDFNLLI